MKRTVLLPFARSLGTRSSDIRSLGILSLGALSLGILSVGCEEEAAPEPEVPEQCRNVHLDRLAADWIGVVSGVGDPKFRMRVMAGDKPGEDYTVWYIGGYFDRITLTGTKRGEDVQLTEQPTGTRKARIEAGEEQRKRLYIKPSLKDCALKVYTGTVDAAGKEQVPASAIEFVAFPAQPGVAFAFQPPTEPLFLGATSRDRTKATTATEAADPSHAMGAVPVGVWSPIEADGDAACTYDMDLYFDDRRVEDLSPKPAGAAEDGLRPWLHDWQAPYSGNHHFELHRFRTCDGSERTLLGIAAIEAVLG